MEESKPIPRVEEILLKKRKRKAIGHAKDLQNRLDAKSKKKYAKKDCDGFRRAESFVKDSRKKKKDRIRVKKSARFLGDDGVKVEPQLAFVIRISDDHNLSPQTQQVLDLLRLKKKLNGTFLHLNQATKKLLTIAEPYITWGYPSLRMIRELVLKRGFGRVKGQAIKKPLSDNTFIEDHLGPHDVICIEDVVHELYTVGPNFKVVNNFIWNMKLNLPEAGFKKRGKHFSVGGDYGDRGDKINDLLMTMI